MSLLIALLLACPAPEPAPPPPEAEIVAAAEPEPEPLPEPANPRYAATHVLITWQGAVRARPGITRDEARARALAEELRARAAGGEPLEELARTYSDGPTAPRGGQLGVYATGTMVPEFERAVASVEVGQLAPLTRSAFGWHVIRRDPVVEVRVSHVLVSWEGALRSGTERSKEDARAAAEAVVARLEAGEDFAAVAGEVSEDATRMVGGDLGRVAHGQMVPAFEDAAFALEVGERSGIVETPYGFHVLLEDRVVLLLVLAALAWGEAPEETPAAVDGLAPLLDAVVVVRQGSGLCAGAFVDAQGHVATAYHCVTAGGRPEVELRDGRRAVGRVVAWEARTDLALIHVEALAGTPHLPLREGPPLQGEAVRAIGHPYAARPPSGFMEGTLRWTVTEGVVAAVGTRAVQITAAVNPGNSGGPVVDDAGRVVGVVSRRMSGEALGFAGRADRLPGLQDEPRGLGLHGGDAGVSVVLASPASSTAVLSVGARLEGALRDRVVASGTLALPLSHRWSAARFPSGVSWTQGEIRAGLRQRLGRGIWTLRLDAYGGASFHSRLTARVDGERIDFDRHDQVAPMAGGALTLGGSGLEVAWVSLDSGWQVRTQITLSWPGTLWIF